MCKQSTAALVTALASGTMFLIAHMHVQSRVKQSIALSITLPLCPVKCKNLAPALKEEYTFSLLWHMINLYNTSPMVRIFHRHSA